MNREPEPPASPMGPYESSLRAASGSESRSGGRHRAPAAGRVRRLKLVALVLVPVLLLSLGAYLLLRPDAGPAGPVACGAERVPLTIAVAPAVEPVLREAAAAFDRGTASWVAGRCTTTTVVSADQDAFADTLRTALEAGGGTNAPTAWVPEAGSWREILARRPELSTALPRSYPVVAVSPAVVAAPRSMAEALGWPEAQPSWAGLLDLAKNPSGWGAKGHPEWGRVRIGWQSPLHDAASLTAMSSLTEWATAGAENVDDLRRDLLSAHSALASVNAEQSTLLAALNDPKVTADEATRQAMLFPTTEREVLRYNATKPRVPLVAMYPTDGVSPIEVPLITVHADWVTGPQRAALDRLAVFLVTGAQKERFVADGWRTPRLETTEGSASGVVATEPRYTPAAPAVTSLAQSLQGWTALDRQGSVLVVLDTSGSMNERVAAAGNATRLDLAKQAIADSLPLFSDRTNIGLWTFSRQQSRTDHTVLLDLGPPSRSVGGKTAVQSLRDSLGALRADGATGLYDTVIAAAARAQQAWREGNNTIVLISDGKNEDPGSASLEQVLAKLAPLAGSERPVRLLTIALGDEADAATLRRLADAAKGEAYVAREAQDLGKVFLAALTD